MHLRLLAIQTNATLAPEARVFLGLLQALPRIAARQGVTLETLVMQGVDARADDGKGDEAARALRPLSDVGLHTFRIGALGRADTAGFSRLLKLRDLALLWPEQRYILDIARRFQPTLVYSAQRGWDLRLAAPLAECLRRPQLVHMHYRIGPWISGPLFQTLRNAQAVVGVSRYICDDVIRHGVPADRTHLLYNSVAPPLCPTRRDEAREAFRDEIGLSADALLVGMVARLFAEKGQESLVQAMLPILRRDRRVHLLLIGDEYPRPNGMGQRIRRNAMRHGVQEQVHLLGYRSDVPRVLAALDVFAHPSRYEPFSLSILEAMAHGLPVVAWGEGGPAELVVHGETGFLVPPMEIDGLTAALDRLVADPPLRVAFGAAGRLRAATRFNSDDAAARFLHILLRTSTERV